MSFRYKNKDVRMLAAEEDFDLNGRKLRAGAFIIPNADRATLEPMIRDLGLSAWAVAAAPAVKTHELKIPRIGYVHSWSRTQDEGWVRAALDHYGVPYTYFADQKLARRQPAREVRRDHLPARGRHVAVDDRRHCRRPAPRRCRIRRRRTFPNLGAID